jgi:hypothetical protein
MLSSCSRFARTKQFRTEGFASISISQLYRGIINKSSARSREISRVKLIPVYLCNTGTSKVRWRRGIGLIPRQRDLICETRVRRRIPEARRGPRGNPKSSRRQFYLLIPFNNFDLRALLHFCHLIGGMHPC